MRLLALAGAILVYTADAQAAETIAYQYDALGRLVIIERSGAATGKTSYRFDRANNRIEKVLTDVIASSNPSPTTGRVLVVVPSGTSYLLIAITP